MRGNARRTKAASSLVGFSGASTHVLDDKFLGRLPPKISYTVRPGPSLRRQTFENTVPPYEVRDPLAGLVGLHVVFLRMSSEGSEVQSPLWEMRTIMTTESVVPGDSMNRRIFTTCSLWYIHGPQYFGFEVIHKHSRRYQLCQQRQFLPDAQMVGTKQ